MRKLIIKEEEKQRILNIHRGVFKSVLSENDDIVSYEDYLDAWETIIVPKMEELQEKMEEQGIDCTVLEGEGCDNSEFGFKQYKTIKRYDFPMVGGSVITLDNNPSTSDEWEYGSYATFGVGIPNTNKHFIFGKFVTTKKEVITAAEDALDIFIEISKDKFPDVFPK